MLPQPKIPCSSFSEQDDQAPSAVPFGLLLKQARERRNLSIEQVCEHLKIRKYFIESIEAEKLNQLPGSVYTIGFIRSYSQFLKIDPEIVQHFLKTINPLPLKDSAVNQPFNLNKPTNYFPSWIMALAVLLSLTVIVYSYTRQDSSRSSKTSFSNTTGIEDGKLSSSAVDFYSLNILNPLKLTFFALEPTWIRLTDSGQKVITNRLLAVGDIHQIDLQDHLYLTTSHPQALEVYKGFNKVALPTVAPTLTPPFYDNNDFLEDFPLTPKEE